MEFDKRLPCGGSMTTDEIMGLADDYANALAKFVLAEEGRAYRGIIVDLDIEVQRARSDLQVAIESLQKHLTAASERVE
jgi:hypothetical protein